MFHKTYPLFRALGTGAVLLSIGSVTRAGTLIATFSSVASGSNVNLTAEGNLDWMHWGLYTVTSLSRKATVVPAISDFTLLGDTNAFLTVYQYADNANGYSWFDGYPEQSVTNTPTGVWSYSTVPIGSGFRIRVPADTTQRTLRMYVGAYNAKGEFTASLSDGSAPVFTNGPTSTVNNHGNGPGGVFVINYSADSAGQFLTVTWTLALPYSADANVTLQAAALSALGADNPPYVALTSPTNAATFPEPAELSFHADAQDFDGTVTNVLFYSGTDLLADLTAAPYDFTWANVARGKYTLTASATDDQGVTSKSQPLQVFVYGTNGSQSVSVAIPPAAVDLTGEGTTDWAHWGLSTNTSFDYKSLVPRQISDFAPLGTSRVQQYLDNYTAFSWSDGTPTPSVMGTTTGVFITGVTNGFRLAVPADTSSRQLRVYVGGYGMQAEFSAFLSDLSSQPYTDVSVSNLYGNSYAVYTIDYAAASSGQELVVTYKPLNLFDFAYGNVTLQAGTLQGAVIGKLPVYITNPVSGGGDFIFSFLSQSNVSYAVQSADSLPGTNWTTVMTLQGTGGTAFVTNHNANAAEQYYRVQTQ